MVEGEGVLEDKLWTNRKKKADDKRADSCDFLFHNFPPYIFLIMKHESDTGTPDWFYRECPLLRENRMF